MNEQKKALVRATVPVLREHGVALTTHFYQRMLSLNPELKHIFNQAHQHSGRQQQALASAVLAYAENIDDPSVLLPVVDKIAHKHTSLGIRAEQYSIVGKHLLASIQEVLGEAATPELVAAWAEAYQSLADLFIGVESKLYQQSIQDELGWTGWRPFKVIKKVAESEEITSFYLAPTDNGPLPQFLAGQYISVRIWLEEQRIYQPRQYSLSQAPGHDALRISVKKEPGRDAHSQGVVSHWLHQNIEEGAILDVSAPFGEFTLDKSTTRPIVLLSGGVGITPMMAMAEEAMRKPELASNVAFLHCARNAKVHAFKSVTDAWAKQGMDVRYFYDSDSKGEQQSAPIDLKDTLQAKFYDADVYLCGPTGFIKHYSEQLFAMGLPTERIHCEAF